MTLYTERLKINEPIVLRLQPDICQIINQEMATVIFLLVSYSVLYVVTAPKVCLYYCMFTSDQTALHSIQLPGIVNHTGSVLRDRIS